ncbi:TetR family transcriptional regulator [Leucobacter coleopterorum]|uniref:TetR family transcriptional regulator n=1 Tax=Leucobacter coleopterorum TaxID=2714933 RepID=A0ABX6JVR1_9MICO|nr:TetR/AcrR family transcriptional regulator C-terminal domain-containing protein [Leucobacter coleopterorum]QIM18402.1 TetR family transcriptional regulator [Leucobacter coleopterorum]
MSAPRSPESQPRKPGRPSRPPLTEADIAQAALDIIDECGWSACTMAALARRLGVRAPSLYHYVSGQQEIVDLVRELVVREIHDPAIVDLPWSEAMHRFGIAYYRAFTNHPNVIQVLSTTPVRDAATLQMYETFLQTLHRDGWEGSRAFEALLGIEHLALGFAFEWNAEDLMLDSALAAGLGAPLLAEITRDRTDQTDIAEASYLSLLRRYIEMFRLELNEIR